MKNGALNMWVNLRCLNEIIYLIFQINLNMDQVARLQDEIETEVNKYNEMHKKAQQLVQTRNSLYEQESENSLVLKEIKMLPEYAKVFKQVGGVLIDQSHKDAATTLSQRVNHINVQIDQISEMIKKNETEQQGMVEKIQKAKAYYAQMIQAMQGKA